MNDLVASRCQGWMVDLRWFDLDPELLRGTDLRQNVCRAQHRVSGDARVVQAPSPDAVLFDDRGPQPELGGADRRDVAARPRSDPMMMQSYSSVVIGRSVSAGETRDRPENMHVVVCSGGRVVNAISSARRSMMRLRIAR
jgi:hypothetical protein